MTAKAHKTYFIRTFGCQMNEHDSGKMAGLLSTIGYVAASAMEEADLILFNTCTIREKAYHKAESEIGRAQMLKQHNGAIIGVCGCVAQQEGVELKKRFGGIDFVAGPDQIAALPRLITSAEQGSFTSAMDFIDDPNHPDFPHNIAEGTVNGGAAFVGIMKGCDNACSYCIVPSVRGREVSRPATDIVAEVERLAERGAREVTLLGQNVNAYGKRGAQADGARVSFVELIELIAAVPAIERIRFTSPHPRDADDELVACYAHQPKLCPHIHLPVQAGSDDVLKRMRRGYDRDRFLRLVDGLKQARPGISITTDMIVGFCGETDADFELTIDLMERVRFDSMFAFCYSPRPGTHAATHLVDDVPPEKKRARLERVLELQRSIQRAHNEAQVGTVKNVLVLKNDDRGAERLTGRAEDNRLVHFAGHNGMIGTIVPVTITKASIHSLRGER